jgi:hypothetical protein
MNPYDVATTNSLSSDVLSNVSNIPAREQQRVEEKWARGVYTKNRTAKMTSFQVRSRWIHLKHTFIRSL